MGSYKIDGELADAIFKKFDKDGNGTLDLKEFTSVVSHCNELAQPFEQAELDFMTSQVTQLGCK